MSELALDSIEQDVLIRPMLTIKGRVYPIRRLRHRLDCSCGVTLGVALDYIDTKKAWRAHVG